MSQSPTHAHYDLLMTTQLERTAVLAACSSHVYPWAGKFEGRDFAGEFSYERYYIMLAYL